MSDLDELLEESSDEEGYFSSSLTSFVDTSHIGNLVSGPSDLGHL